MIKQVTHDDPLPSTTTKTHETEVIGALLTLADFPLSTEWENAVADAFDKLKPEFFKTEKNTALFRILRDFFRLEWRIPSLTTITEVARKDPVFFGADTEVAVGEKMRGGAVTSVSFTAAVDCVIGAATLRARLAEAEIYVERLRRADADPEESASIDADHLRRLAEIADGNTEKYYGKSIGQISFETMDALDKGELERRFPTGFTKLDEALSGGLRVGTLNIIAARPSVGKTAMMTQIATHIATRQTTSLIVTLEMAEAEIYKRVYLQSTNHIWPPNPETAASTETLKINTLPLYVYDRPATIETVEELAARYRRKERIKAVFIDYVGLIRPTRNQNKNATFERLEENAGRLKELAKREKIAVVLLAQMNREAAKSRGTLSELRGSGGLEQAADVVLSLSRNDEENRENVTLEILKNRDGITGKIPLYFNGPRCRFQESLPTQNNTPTASPSDGFGLDEFSENGKKQHKKPETLGDVQFYH